MTPAKRIVDPQPPTKWFLTVGFHWVLGQLPRGSFGARMNPPDGDTESQRNTPAEDNTAMSGRVRSTPQSA